MKLLAFNKGKWLYSLQFRDLRKPCTGTVTGALLFESSYTHKLGEFFPITPEVLVKWM